MSDGNFNRALLPHTPFYSGLNAGRKQMRQLAIDCFKEVAEAHDLDLSLRDEFIRLLDAKWTQTGR